MQTKSLRAGYIGGIVHNGEIHAFFRGMGSINDMVGFSSPHRRDPIPEWNDKFELFTDRMNLARPMRKHLNYMLK